MMFQNKMTSTIPIAEINIRHVDGMALQEWAGMGLTDVRERERVCVCLKMMYYTLLHGITRHGNGV